MADTLNRILKNARLLTEAVQFDTYNFTIGTHFLSPLINGDFSGLRYEDEDGQDEAALNAFLAKIPKGGDWSYESGDEGYIGRDDVTGMKAHVMDLTYYVPKRETPQMGEDNLQKSPLKYDPNTNTHNGKVLKRGDVLTDSAGKRLFAVERNNGYMLSVTELGADMKPTGKEYSVSVDPTDKPRFYPLVATGKNIFDTSVAMGEDKPKKRVLPKRPAKRPNDDNIAGAYKELDKQKWQNAEKSMKAPQK